MYMYTHYAERLHKHTYIAVSLVGVRYAVLGHLDTQTDSGNVISLSHLVGQWCLDMHTEHTGPIYCEREYVQYS